MKTLRMMRNIAALFIVVTALASASQKSQKPGTSQQVPSWCVQAINPCCCRNGKTHLERSDPRYPTCESTCSVSKP
jgi:hypothetical protein